jgi:hypothetical protein
MSSAVPNPKMNYQGNSKVDREIAAEEATPKEERKIQKIEGVNVVKTKKSVGKRIKEGFGGADMQSVGSYLMWDVMIPAARDLVFDIIIEGARGSLYGDSARRSSAPIGSTRSGIVGSSNTRLRTSNYSAATRSPIVGSQSSTPSMSSNAKAQFDFSELILDNRVKAEEIILKMQDALAEFGLVSVAEFYDALEISGNGFTDQKHGWNSETFQGARVRPARGGFLLDIPQPSPFE